MHSPTKPRQTDSLPPTHVFNRLHLADDEPTVTDEENDATVVEAPTRTPARSRRSRAEGGLDRQLRRLAALAPSEATLQAVLDMALEHVPAAQATALRLTSDGSFSVRAERPLPRPRGSRVLGLGVARLCCQERLGFALNDLHRRRLGSLVVEPEVRSALCAPLESRGLVVGCLLLINARDQANFERAHLDALAKLAPVAAAMLRR